MAKYDISRLTIAITGSTGGLGSALAKALQPGAAAWLIYRKGGTINGDALIHAARAAGLKDTKVARISESHAGLRFIAAKA